MSGKLADTDVDISSVANEKVGATGVPNSADLVGWAEGVLARDLVATEHHRIHILDELGVDAANDAAGVIATFNMVTRMADATGIPLERGFDQSAERIEAELGIAHIRHD